MDYKYVHNETKYNLNVVLHTLSYPNLTILNLPPRGYASFNIPNLPVDPRPTGITFIDVNGSFRLAYNSSDPDSPYFGNYLKNNKYAIHESLGILYDFYLEFSS